jgi:hypothetical protein
LFKNYDSPPLAWISVEVLTENAYHGGLPVTRASSRRLFLKKDMTGGGRKVVE